jgi:hypothetical protein
MHLPEGLSGMCMRKEVKGQGVNQKAYFAK